MDLLTSSLVEIRDAIRERKISAEQVTRFFLDRIEKLNPHLKAFSSVNPNALEDAKRIDQRLAKGEDVGPLAGVPIGIKDLLCTKGMATTANSKILENFVPPYSATVVTRLEEAGAIIIGKTNLDEFAMGSSNENSPLFGVCRNPWNTDYVPGGSSGGSAAAVAARLVPGTIGTDTGGSIRQPASFCGIAGIKPTYGRISRYGIIAFASSLDQAGPMALTSRDCALMLEVISGLDKYDATSASQEVPKFSETKGDVKGMTIGIPKQYMSDGLSAEVRDTVLKTKAYLESQGAKFVEVDLALTEYSVPVYYLVAASEASSNLARYDGVRFGYRADFSKHGAESLEEFYARTRGEGFGAEVKRRIVLGTYALSSGYFDAYYIKACQVRRLLQDEFLRAFEKCDVIFGPVTTTPAFRIGERVSDPLTMYLNDIFTTSINLAGLPGMAVPASLSSEGLPIGVQLIAKHFDEASIFRVAECIGNNVKFEQKVPNV